MPFLFRSRKKHVVEEVRRVSSRVDEYRVPRDVDVDKFIYVHLSRAGREIVDRSRAGGVCFGARQAIHGKLYKLKYLPKNATAYTFTMNAVEQTYGVEVNDPYQLYEIVRKKQGWRASSIITFTAVSTGLKWIDDTYLDKLPQWLRMDIEAFKNVDIAGYIKGAEILDKLPDSDKVFLLSTLYSLSDALRLAPPSRTPQIYRYDQETGKIAVVRQDRNARERPLMDGYIKIRFADPGFKKFDEAVEKHLAEITKGAGEKKHIAETIWKTLKPSIHAFAPAWYNFLGFDAEEHMPRIVAETIYELAEKYVELREKSRNPFRNARQEAMELVNTLAEAYGLDKNNPEDTKILAREVGKLYKALAPRDLRKYALSRLPYMVARIGEKIGCGFKLEQVFKYIGRNKHDIKVSQWLLRQGIVLSPIEVSKATEAGFKHTKITRMIYGENYIGLNTAYAFYYALGVPVTTAVSSDAEVMTTTNLKYAIDHPEILDMNLGVDLRKLGINARIPSIGEILFKKLDKTIRLHLAVAYNMQNTEKPLKTTDPRLYQSILYIFTDLNFADGDRGRFPAETHNKLINIVQEITSQVTLAKLQYIDHKKEIEKSLRKGKLTKKTQEYIGQLLLTKTRIESEANKILELARFHTPKYIGVLAKRSENIYKTLLEQLESPPPVLPTDEAPDVQEILTQTHKHIQEAIQTANNTKEFQKYWSLRRIRQALNKTHKILGNNIYAFTTREERNRIKEIVSRIREEDISRNLEHFIKTTLIHEYIPAIIQEQQRREEEKRKEEEKKKKQEQQEQKPPTTPPKPQPAKQQEQQQEQEETKQQPRKEEGEEGKKETEEAEKEGEQKKEGER